MIDLRIRCDGGEGIGLGHVMRSLSLAQACREDGTFHVRFFTREGDGVALREIRNAGFEALAISQTASVREEPAILAAKTLGDRSRAVVWVDHYGWNPAEFAELRRHDVKTTTIDDHRGGVFPVDLLVNPNPGSESLGYRTLEGGRALLGIRYVMLRKSILDARALDRHFPDVARSVAIAFGGSDSEDRTSKVLLALRAISNRRLESLRIRVVLGPSYRGKARSIAESWGRRVVGSPEIVDASGMREVLLDSDMIVTAAGSTCYESAYLGLPAIYLRTAQNQSLVERGLCGIGAGISLGDAAVLDESSLPLSVESLALDRERRREMSEQGMAAVDGLGARRVCEALRNLFD